MKTLIRQLFCQRFSWLLLAFACGCHKEQGAFSPIGQFKAATSMTYNPLQMITASGTTTDQTLIQEFVTRQQLTCFTPDDEHMPLSGADFIFSTGQAIVSWNGQVDTFIIRQERANTILLEHSLSSYSYRNAHRFICEKLADSLKEFPVTENCTTLFDGTKRCNEIELLPLAIDGKAIHLMAYNYYIRSGGWTAPGQGIACSGWTTNVFNIINPNFNSSMLVPGDTVVVQSTHLALNPQ